MYFFFNDTATTEIYTLSLHDALPIYNGDIQYTLINEGISSIEKISKIDSEKQTKLLAMIKETGFMAIPFDSFVIKDETVDFVKYGVKITYNEKTNQLFWPEQEATEQLIPPIISEVEVELESILNSIRE